MTIDGAIYSAGWDSTDTNRPAPAGLGGHPAEDEVVLHLIASGVIALEERVRGGGALSLPYPSALQRGLDKLTVLCIRRGERPPKGVPDLLEWCRAPLSGWPLELPADAVGPSDALLSGSMPTRACEEWAIDSPDVEADVLERRLLGDVLSACRAAGDQAAYAAFRRLLIERPVLTALEWQVQLSQPELGLLSEHVRAAYIPAPVEYVVGGQFRTCATCGDLLAPVGSRTAPGFACADERCAGGAAPAIGRTIGVREGAMVLRRELRTFIGAPGRAELRIAGALRSRGFDVELWPSFDAYDLRVLFPGGDAWAADVKDWCNPFLLARSVHPIPPSPPWTRAFFVFPQERIRRRADYLRAFRHRCHILGGSPPTDAVMERDFLALVGDKIEGRG